MCSYVPKYIRNSFKNGEMTEKKSRILFLAWRILICYVIVRKLFYFSGISYIVLKSLSYLTTLANSKSWHRLEEGNELASEKQYHNFSGIKTEIQNTNLLSFLVMYPHSFFFQSPDHSLFGEYLLSNFHISWVIASNYKPTARQEWYEMNKYSQEICNLMVVHVGCLYWWMYLDRCVCVHALKVANDLKVKLIFFKVFGY